MTTEKPSHADVFWNEYINNSRRDLFPTFNYAHARKKGPRYDQSRACNAILYDVIASSLNGEKAVYCAGSISKGMVANGFVMQEKPFLVHLDNGRTLRAHHVYDLDETIGSQNFLDEVLRHNRRMQIQKLNLLGTVMPDHPVLVPVVLQGAVSFAGQPNFDLGGKRRDNDYMQLWDPLITEHSNAVFVAGDWFFSGATSGLEYPAATAIAAGLRERRPDADMRFLDINGKDVPLADMNRRYVEYLVWAAEQKDFYLKHEPTALMRNFAIATMAERGELPNANPVFLKGILDTLEETRHLEKAIKPLAIERVASGFWEMNTTDLEKTDPGFVEKIEEAKKGQLRRPRISLAGITQKLEAKRIHIHHYTAEELRRGNFELEEIARKISPWNYLSLTEGDAAHRPMRSVDMAGEAAYVNDGRSLFSRPLLPLINEREKMQSGVVFGALETIMPAPGRFTYIVADDKYGPETEKLRDAHKLAYGDEVPNIAGVDFGESVRKPQRQMILDLQEKMREEGRHVLSGADFQHVFGLFRDLPQVAVAPGEAIPGSAARTLARHAFLARNVTDFVFKSGQWEQSNDGVQDMVLATRMQLGLQAGSQVDPQYVRVVDEKGQNMPLAARATAIWGYLKDAMEKGRDPKDLDEPATALAQLWSMHRLASDHAMRLRVFEKLRGEDANLVLPKDLAWERISPFVFAGDKPFEDLWRKEVRPALEGPLALAVRTRHLEHIEDFVALRRRQEAELAIAEAGEPEYRVLKRRVGGSVPQS